MLMLQYKTQSNFEKTHSLQKFHHLVSIVAHTLIPALGRQRQADLCEFEASLVYRVSSRTARTVIQRNSVSKQTKIPSLKSPTTLGLERWLSS